MFQHDKTITLQGIVDYPIIGQRVMLKKASPDDAEFLSKWYNTKAFRRLFRLSHTRPFSVDSIAEGLVQKNNLLNTLRQIEWIVWRKQKTAESLLPIGLVNLVDVNQIHKTAELQIGIVSPDDRVSGIAAEASFLAMEFAFKVLALFKLHTFVYGFNHHSQKSTVSLGFTQEGILREQYWDPYEQKHIDLYFNGLLSREFWKNERIAKLSSRLLGRDITLQKSVSQLPSVKMYSHNRQQLSEIKVLLSKSFFDQKQKKREAPSQ
ncbi:GNAT family N-acetyltransferase [Nitrosomonas sp.]|uniref:GNAT family N-acetyltransferase n=1 Tax=Nitrosomonas sp. TaxID=42353 RepID=UPI002843952A|nr:GNAT family N-acetyltransferase [Nitrosomonas sp.]MDR4515733.1 GNAT family N-acetyltransferase [Nitrosomonas sp.]